MNHRGLSVARHIVALFLAPFALITFPSEVGSFSPRPSACIIRSSFSEGTRIAKPSRSPLLLGAAEEPSFGDNIDVNGSNRKNKRRPKTGWNHNLPSEESGFWLDASSASDNPDSTTTRSTEFSTTNENEAAEDGEEEPRTGWLHNTKSKRDLEQDKQQAKAGGSTSSPGRGETDARKLLRREMEKSARNHRILGQPTFHPVGDKRVVVTEHKIAVPLSRNSDASSGGAGEDVGLEDVFLPGVNVPGIRSTGPTIDIYFTVAETVDSEEHEAFFANTLALSESIRTGTTLQNERADLYVSHSNLTSADKMMLYLQGGPGFGAPAPLSGIGLGEKSSWASEALGKGFKRVVLMDQRGTGRSTPITKQTLERRFPDLFALDEISSVTENDEDYGQSTGAGFASIAEQLDRWEAMNPELAARVGVGIGQAAEYMSNFRADNIVKDAEDVKNVLLMPTEDMSTPRPWGAALGQSYGGFCMMSYLSLIPSPPKICLLTGGIAPMLMPAYDAYQRLWDRVKERNLAYYDHYPGDIPLVKRIVRRLLEKAAPLLSGGRLTARRFLQLGLSLGGSPSAFASLHTLLASAFLEDHDGGDEGEFTRAFLKRIDSEQSFDDHPIYFLLHESIYADGPSNSPTEWAAHRAFEDLTKTPSEFSYDLTARLDSDDRPTLFTGEMVFPWQADGDYSELSGFGMRALAQSLACKDDWGPLYNKDSMRRALAPGGPCKAAAAVYYDDMYVDFDCSMMVTARGGPLENCKVYVTNEYQHSGLRDDGATIFTKLLGVAKGSIRIPS